MLENFREFIAEASHMMSANAKFKERQKLNKKVGSIAYSDAIKFFGYGPDDKFGYFDMQHRYFLWRGEVFTAVDEEKKLNELIRMGRAVDYCFYTAREHTASHPAPEETAFMEQSKKLWNTFSDQYKKTMEHGDACVIFFSHAFGPASPQFLIDLFKYANPVELTYLFHTKRESCTSVEQARQFDLAYSELFCTAFTASGVHIYLDHPYSLVLDGTLDKPLPLPGVEIELTTPVMVAVPEPVTAKTSHQEVEITLTTPVLGTVPEPAIGKVTEKEIAQTKSKLVTVVDNVLQSVAPSFAQYRRILAIQEVSLSKINAGEWDPPPFTKEEKRLIGYVNGSLGSPYRYYRNVQEQKTAQAQDQDYVYIVDRLKHLRDARTILNTQQEVRKHVEYSAKIERIILKDLLEQENAPLRTYLNIIGSCLADFDVEPGFFAGPPAESYVKLVHNIVSRTKADKENTPAQSLDWVLFSVPGILAQIRGVLGHTTSNYDRTKAFEQVPWSVPGLKDLRAEMETHSAWLQERREEAFMDFKQAFGTQETQVMVAVPEPVLAEAPQETVVEAPAPSSAMTQPFIKKPREKLPPVAASGEMTVAHAREVFDYSKDEVVIELELTRRYRNLTRKNYSDEAQDEIDMAYKVLLKIAS